MVAEVRKITAEVHKITAVVFRVMAAEARNKDHKINSSNNRRKLLRRRRRKINQPQPFWSHHVDFWVVQKRLKEECRKLLGRSHQVRNSHL